MKPIGINLNVGCGRHVLDGWTNVDVVPSPRAARAPEILAPAWSIPLPDASVSELMGIHIFEHFYRWEADTVLVEWRRLMCPGARLVLEMPDLIKCCQNVVDGREEKVPGQWTMWGLFGDPREGDVFMSHHWAWTFKTLAPVLEAHGFVDCKEEQTEWHRIGMWFRDFRITARRG